MNGDIAAMAAQAAQFASLKWALSAAIIEALGATPLVLYYRDTDLIVRIRKGNILPTVEFQDRPAAPDSSFITDGK